MIPEPYESTRFTIDPREGTASGAGGSVRLEPKVMKVLAELARHPGKVVSREELMDTVWPGMVVTEHTLSRCIYQLRQDLGKIATEQGDGAYNPIETLPKRGYRLLAGIETLQDRYTASPQERPSMAPAIPFVVGQWVRGERFYGRTAQIAEILEGHRNCVWLLGTRRIGKTSLLKQIEYIADTSFERRYFPVFWDLQGTETPAELHLNFADALLDADERLEHVGISLDDVQSDDLFVSLERLRRLLRGKNMGLLLLCDEVEELIGLNSKAPSLLRKLRHAMQSREDIRTVLASTIRLWTLADEKHDTSPFLHGFTPPLYIERLSEEEANALIEQSQLGPEERPQFEPGVADQIRTQCDSHPYLVQLVCKRYLESGAIEEAIEQVATDRMVSYFFSVDFDMLSETERGIVESIAGDPLTSDSIRDMFSIGPDTLMGTLRRLENLGFIRKTEEHAFELSNYFFRRWLKAMQDESPPAVAATGPPQRAEAEQASAIDSDEPPAVGLFDDLKRRNVFRVGLAYIVIAWLLLQVGEIMFDFLEVPVWAGKLLIVFLALGFPVALVLAWAFELTPEGVKRDSDVDRSKSDTRQIRRKFNHFIIAALVIAVTFFALGKFL